MTTLLRFLLLLSLVVWVGGIVFFSIIEAPTVLHIIADRQVGGAIIGNSLYKLRYVGITCGLIFLIASLRLAKVETGAAGFFQLSNLLVLGMLALTLISQHVLLPAVAELRSAPLTPAASVQFQRLHSWSVGLEGATLALGLAVLFLTSRRMK